MCYATLLQYVPLQCYQSRYNEHVQDLEYKAHDKNFQCQLYSFISKSKDPKVIISNRLGLKVETMKAMHKHVRVTWYSRIVQYLPGHRWSYPSSLRSLGSCLRGSPSVRPSSSTRPRRRRSSSFGMPCASRSFGHAPSGSCCHAAAGIWEQPAKSNSSSCVDWLNACRRCGAPSAPWVSLSKHLECFVRINLSKTHLDYKTWRIVKVSSNSYDSFTNLNSDNIQQRQISTHRKYKKTLQHVSLRGTDRNLPSSSWAT